MAERNEVPCAGCRACCRGERVILSPDNGDDPGAYWTIPVQIGEAMELMVAHKPNGDCVYLVSNGCAIHDHAPWACRHFDCRNHVRGTIKNPLLMVDDLEGHVAEAGRKRLERVEGIEPSS